MLKPERLSPAASSAFEQAARAGDAVYLSAISVVEIAYLVENGRFLEQDWDLLLSLFASPAHRLVVAPLDMAVATALRAIPRGTIPEMPDRIIAATAMVLDLPLVTRDLRIRSAGPRII